MNKLYKWVLISLGCLSLFYAIIGNYVALPGYIRFLERGGVSEAGNAFDLSVFIGAAKTIIWMYSFQIGVICLALVYAIQNGLHARSVFLLSIIWLALWSWPSLPAPGGWFYIFFGSLIMFCIVLTMLNNNKDNHGSFSQTLFLLSLMFFAFATWEICGLGATGRMLHPEQAAKPIAHNLLITQSSKLMIEFLIAWSLMLASFLLSKRKPEAV